MRDYENGDPRVDPDAAGSPPMYATFWTGFAVYLAYLAVSCFALSGLWITDVCQFFIYDGVMIAGALIPFITVLVASTCKRAVYGSKNTKVYSVEHYIPYAMFATALLVIGVSCLAMTLNQWLSYEDRRNPADFQNVRPCTGADDTDLCYSRQASIATMSWKMVNQLRLCSVWIVAPLFVYCAQSVTSPRFTKRFEEDAESGAYSTAVNAEKRTSPPKSARTSSRHRKTKDTKEPEYSSVNAADD